jgi:hypothetical protein
VKFRAAISDKYPWGLYDAVEIRYWDMGNTNWVPVQSDDELGIMFATNAETKTVELEINVIQRLRGETERRGTRSQAHSSQARCSQTRGRGSSGARGNSGGRGSSGGRRNSENSLVHEPGPSSSNQADADPIIEEEQPDDVPTDDEDELMHPEFVIGKKPKGKEAAQQDDYIAPPEFDQTDSDEREEENDMGYSESSDEARPDVHFDRDDPSLAEGTIFSDVVECRNALATYAINTQSEFKIDKSEPGRLTVHCAYRRCKWRMHASFLKNTKLLQVH